MSVIKIIIHEDYDDFTIDYDFALLRLATAIKFDATKQPIALPEQDEKPNTGQLALVSGWGTTQNEYQSSSYLRAAEVPIRDSVQCNKSYAIIGGITDRMLCAGLKEGGKDGNKLILQV